MLSSVLFVVALAARTARAHDVGISRGDYVVLPGDVEARLVFAAQDGALLSAPAELIFVDADDTPCRKTDERMTPLPGEDAVEVDLRFSCAPGAASVVLQAGFLVDGSHRHLAHITFGAGDGREGRVVDTILYAGHERVQVAVEGAADAAGARAPGFLALLRLGASHVLGGWDHLAFLLALALEGASFVELLRLVTAFTVAHSASLALAATGTLRPPASWVEPLVALSIAVVGAQAALGARAPSPSRARSRWPVAFVFGLVHGLAFADALRTLGLHGGALARALLGFNLGVEGGQLVALAAFVPMLALLARLGGGRARVGRAVGGVLALVGLLWFAWRVSPFSGDSS